MGHRPPPPLELPPPPGSHARSLSRTFQRSRPAALAPGRLSCETSADPEPGPGLLERRPPSLELSPPAEDADLFRERPPASRRAASAGPISSPLGPGPRASSQTRWTPGMPLPPPPPGPPPQSGLRSQSLTRISDAAAATAAVAPLPRRAHAVASLGPIPPTPVGWVESSARPGRRSPSPALRVDTSALPAHGSAAEMSSGGSSAAAALARSGAVRGEPKSIRERRSESRGERAPPLEDPSNNPWADAITPADIVLPQTALGRRPPIPRTTPRSARSAQSQQSPDTWNNSSRRASSAAGTASSAGQPSPSSRDADTPTPPFSPDPPPAPSAEHPPTAPVPRPTPPLVPPVRSPNNPFSPSSFCRGAIERHKAFAEREAAAATNEERVRLFAEFIVAESRLRRDRYASAIDAMGSELLELTRDLFRPYSRARRESPKNVAEVLSSASESQSAKRFLPPLQTGSAPPSTPSPASDFASTADVARDSSYHGYKPSLSPIAASMAASEAPDESSSRGRPSSRWWEVGGSTSGSPTRSKRETKYMGVPKEARESLQWEDIAHHPPPSSSAVSCTTHIPNETEYPPEKTGWHEEPPVSSARGKTPTGFSFAAPSPVPPATPNPKHLDVSRLVTLPPPFPRHHPALSNSHPDLTEIRTSVRVLSNLSEIESTRERFQTKDQQINEDAASAAAKRRQSLHAHIQREIDAGAMNYADAAKLEAETSITETEATKSQSKASFDLFQSSVVTPLNDILMDRIQRATTLFEQLRSKLFDDAQQESPNIPQEEGDEQPELLEKLTLLKWIFEARETLHREVYDLLSDRNDRYRDIVTEPYRLAGNDAKVANAEQFFAQDVLKRKVEYETDALGRTMELMDVVESNVLRGVELQLSAFWDIAPPLRQVTDKVPKTLTREFGVVIPREEYQDNPDYAQFPLQYLYHLLQHGEKSTYQFIESQTNLLCLLHEVKSLVTAVKSRVDLAEAAKAGDVSAEERVSAEMASEESRLTTDLKEKVRCIEDQWASALGREFDDVKARVKQFLLDQGGWEGVED